MNTNKLLTIIGIILMTFTFGISSVGAAWDANESDYHSEFYDNEPISEIASKADVTENSEDLYACDENEGDYHSEFFGYTTIVPSETRLCME